MRSTFLIFVAGCCCGCVQSGELATLKASLRTSEEAIVAASSATVTKTDEAIGILKENTSALSEIKDKVESLEASLVDSRSVRKEDDQQSAPEPPAKANDTQISPKVATPGAFQTASDGTRLRWSIEGDWNPTILETSAHLRAEHGIDTNGMAHQEMADIHADLHDGKQVAMKSKTVVRVNRGTSCPNGRCPTSSNQRRGLFGGLFR